MAEPSRHRDDVGKAIAGHYRIDALLGRGGNAAVYRVVDTRAGTKLALKLGAALSPRDARRRKELLEREYHSLAQLAHPCIIEVYDYGVDERGRPYYTMELLDGSDLHDSDRLPWQRVCALLRDVASSLAMLHSRGMVHRDISGRNVRCTADGRAKLIDFGAMTSMGVAQDVVGTPPFLAPEVLQMQALDARVDLYSLGALAYYLLTGRHAFPARRIHELRDAWRSAPVSPQRSVPEIPTSLATLVLQLLSLDRNARPHSAAEVMARLSTLAGLPLAEQAQVSAAYLTTPILVGRDRELVNVRKHMLSLARGDGATILIQGVSGSGRSRMLDACALEAKLVGAQVVRAGPSDERADWELARVLGAQLLSLLPEQAQEAARLSRSVLAHVIDGLRSDAAVTNNASDAVVDRNLLIRELRDFILALARSQRLLVVVDDADRIDEPSAALLAALAHKTARHPLVLALSVDRDVKSNGSASLRLLHLVAVPIDLHQLSATETESLVRSIFGPVPNLPLIAAKVHALSQGNPRTIMELSQHLVDRGLARYQAGTWSLPDMLSDRDLPSTLAASLGARLGRLSQIARELCEALCLADSDGSALCLDDFAALSNDRNSRETFKAFDELLAARVLSADGAHYRFSQRGFVAVVEASIEPARLRSLHGRLADRLAAVGGDLIRRVQHLFGAARESEAVELLCSSDLEHNPPPVELLELAIASAQRENLPTRTLHGLRRALLIKATRTMAFESYLRHAPLVFAQLAKDSGYHAYVNRPELPEAERLTSALHEAQRCYEDTDERERVYEVQDAIAEFAQFSLAARATGILMLDPAFTNALPSLAPFAVLSPALQLVALAGEGTVEWLHGRFSAAHALYEQVLSRLDAPDRANLRAAEYTRLRLSVHYGLGVLEASRGIAAAETHANALEQEREYRVNAWRVRRLWHLNRGNVVEASQCQRRAELLLLQDGVEQAYAGTNMLSELMVFVLAGDLLGIQEALIPISALAEKLPGWRPFLALGKSSSQQLQGDPSAALATLLPALDQAKPLQHPAFSFLAGAHVSVLSDLQRHAEAVEYGLRYLEIAEREQLSTTGQLLHVATAEALAHTGQFDSALRLIDSVIEIARARGQTGVSIGTMYEARARIALLQHDRAGFEHFAGLCAAEYRHGTSPFLAARFARLLDQQRPSGQPALQMSASLREALPAVNTEYLTIHSRMLECVDDADRARCVLTMLLQDMESFAGYLFGVRDGQPVLLAALPEDSVGIVDDLGAWLRRWLAAELALGDEQITSDLGRVGTARGVARCTLRDGRRFEPVLLLAERELEQWVAGVLLFPAQAATIRPPNRELRAHMARELLEHRSVTGLPLRAVVQTETRRG
jgi:hypothetical protein